MLSFCLLALPWMAEPASLEHPKSELTSVIATCVRPAALVIEASAPCAFLTATSADSSLIKKWLNRWESATHDRSPRTRSEQEEFRRRIHDTFNEHALAAAEQFVGQVNVSYLNETFDWRIIENGRQIVGLEAIPRDEVERLFYGSLRIFLDSDTGTPKKLVIIGRNQRHRTVWQAQESKTSKTEHPIELIRFENDVPPAPENLLRTVDARID